MTMVGGVLLMVLNVSLVVMCLPDWPAPDSLEQSGGRASPAQLILGATKSPPALAAVTTPHPSHSPSPSSRPSTSAWKPTPQPVVTASPLEPNLPQKTFVPNPPPWLAWRPSGRGTVWVADLPAPWNDASATTEDIAVYTPPGYDPGGSRRYPTLYEAPFNFSLWDSSMSFKVNMDSLIDRGTIPPMIAVLVNAWRAPIFDTECANSVDGRQWMDTFISKTVVSFVDRNYRTDARPEARGVFGFSQGGYCAAILALRHPDVFTTSIPFSGYFRAGDGDSSSTLPFGGDPAALAAASPILIAPRLTSDERAKLYFIVVAKPTEPLLGVDAKEFEQVLNSAGYDYAALDSTLGHSWEQVRRELSGAFRTWGLHMVKLGVFAT